MLIAFTGHEERLMRQVFFHLHSVANVYMAVIPDMKFIEYQNQGKTSQYILVLKDSDQCSVWLVKNDAVDTSGVLRYERQSFTKSLNMKEKAGTLKRYHLLGVEGVEGEIPDADLSQVKENLSGLPGVRIVLFNDSNFVLG